MNDIEYLLENYGDKLKIGVRQPMFSDDASDHDKVQAASEMVSKYGAYANSVYTMSHFQDPIFRKHYTKRVALLIVSSVVER